MRTASVCEVKFLVPVSRDRSSGFEFRQYGHVVVPVRGIRLAGLERLTEEENCLLPVVPYPILSQADRDYLLMHSCRL